jgi:hypothetical protein
VRKGKADSSGSWTRVEEFPNSSSALRLAVLFGLERAALALGHHANLHTWNGLFLTLGVLDIARLGLALVLVGGFWTGCIAEAGLLGKSSFRLDARHGGSLRLRFEPTF